MVKHLPHLPALVEHSWVYMYTLEHKLHILFMFLGQGVFENLTENFRSDRLRQIICETPEGAFMERAVFSRYYGHPLKNKFLNDFTLRDWSALSYFLLLNPDS